ncbi:MAG: fumarylacetoacetate hydrolase family protein [Bacteroidales bacterium]|nr:fumarylacetoacetate hydrolase family protein [Bacteroidales bacterium]MDD3892067.1 fumarylacetoacetate hydrolase family protein [Bacteroidales bacterium]
MKIICIGRNYTEHAKEMASPVPDKPIFFFKPDTALLRNNQPFFYPFFSNDVHHEVEVVIKINRLGRNIAEKFAHRYYSEIGLGIDFTARDLQQECKQKGLPWEISKAFDGAAPISNFISIKNLGDVNSIDFWLDKNDRTVQRGNTSQMIFSINRLIAYLSQFVTLKIGDLIYTGTPSGVGPIKVGDRLKAYMNDNLMLDFFIR